MKQVLLIVVAASVGFAGGIVGARMFPSQTGQTPARVLRAHSFELVNDSGQVVSFWGIDKGKQVVLAFGNSHQKTDVKDPIPPEEGLDEPSHQRTAIGLLGDGSPFLALQARDGKPRERLSLTEYDKPILLMDDETGVRVSLGLAQSDTPGPRDNDWSLDFYPRRASIGMYNIHEGDQVYVRGFVSVHKDNVKYPF